MDIPAGGPSVYTYFDFRSYLKDRQRWLKARKPFFTLEYIAEKLELKSKGHVSLIFSGVKSVPESKISLLADVFFLVDREKEFFQNLIQYNQEQTYRQKKMHLDRMVSLMRISDKKLVPAQYRLCEKWFYPIVLEVIRIHDISDDWSLLGKLVRPQITATEAKEAIQLLRGLDLIQQNAQGFWEPTGTILTFGEGWKSVAARAFQGQAIEMAQQALVEVPVQDRDISTLTLSMGKETFERIQQSIYLLRKEILAAVQADQSADRVYQMNVSLYPVSFPKESV